MPPYMHAHHLSEVLIGTVFSVYGIGALASLGFPVAYFALAGLLRRWRTRAVDSAHGIA